LERKNFAYYDSLAGLDGVVYDFGCGYGYLSYYLHYKSKKRSIIASDYDETKITVAANGMHLNTNLHFLTADIRSQTIKPFTLALVNDVLHYLTPKEQQEFLVKLGANCSDGGTILIRDGEVQQSANLKRTQLTEWLSTKVFKFNKTSNSLNFISSEEINKFALNNNFSLEKKLHSKFTSNVLWILKKQA
jgi:2-polyprenyl-3-methyl-5-hydroxy-6-metoxy-1,4-benzoquinol methylase